MTLKFYYTLDRQESWKPNYIFEIKGNTNQKLCAYTFIYIYRYKL